MTPDRLSEQLDFILEIDRLKSVVRRSLLLSGERCENSAEHCWHTAVMALLLAEHANEPVDAAMVARMMLIHDIVEIDAGDTYCYDEEGNRTKAAREQAAAERLFGLLPGDQGRELRAAWEEFESGESAEARFARALDRLMPLLHNYHTQGRAWQEHGVRVGQVLDRNAPMREGSEALWQYAESFIRDAVDKGYLAP